MTYSQKANPNATDSELDAKRIVYPDYRGIPDCDLAVSLTEDQISTILYVLEGYMQGNDDDELVQEMDEIFEKLETVVDNHHDMLEDLCKDIKDIPYNEFDDPLM